MLTQEPYSIREIKEVVQEANEPRLCALLNNDGTRTHLSFFQIFYWAKLKYKMKYGHINAWILNYYKTSDKTSNNGVKYHYFFVPAPEEAFNSNTTIFNMSEVNLLVYERDNYTMRLPAMSLAEFEYAISMVKAQTTDEDCEKYDYFNDHGKEMPSSTKA